MNWWHVAAGIALVGTGYLFAVFIATAVTLGLLLLFTALAGDGELVPLGNIVAEFAGFAFAGAVITFATALPGFLVALWYSIRRHWSGWRPFVLAGGADAIAALAVLDAFSGGSSSMPFGLMLPTVPAGFAGGLAYWLTAGRIIARIRAGETA